MTEIPEHLLKRSKQRRAAMGRGDGDGDADAGEADAAADTPAADPAAPAAAVEKAPARAAPRSAEPVAAAPAPLSPTVEAAMRRRRVPVWAMPVLALLPVWAVFYLNAMEVPPAGENDPMVRGEALYDSNCSTCHGVGGEGGVGPALNNGAVLQTWPDAGEQVEWVNLGSTGWPGDTYGAQNKPKNGGMPGFEGQLDEEEILLIVRYEREVFGAEDPAEACALTEEIEAATCEDI